MARLHVVIDLPAPQHRAVGEFWQRALGCPLGDPWPTHPELRSFEPSRGAAYVHLQEIDGPPRVHFDVGSTDPESTVARALALGAELVSRHDLWQTLRSPGGLPFCVLRAPDQELQGVELHDPAAWPDGHRSRMVQVCVDSPQSVHDQEVAFWRALLVGRWVGSDAREFAGKWHDDDGSPLQLLFQRLEEPEGPVRAHLDHGTDDLPAEVARLCGLGAADIGPGRGWHVLQDPSGQAFCVTENSPAHTRTRPFSS